MKPKNATRKKKGRRQAEVPERQNNFSQATTWFGNTVLLSRQIIVASVQQLFLALRHLICHHTQRFLGKHDFYICQFATPELAGATLILGKSVWYCQIDSARALVRVRTDPISFPVQLAAPPSLLHVPASCREGLDSRSHMYPKTRMLPCMSCQPCRMLSYCCACRRCSWP